MRGHNHTGTPTSAWGNKLGRLTSSTLREQSQTAGMHKTFGYLLLTQSKPSTACFGSPREMLTSGSGALRLQTEGCGASTLTGTRVLSRSCLAGTVVLSAPSVLTGPHTAGVIHGKRNRHAEETITEGQPASCRRAQGASPVSLAWTPALHPPEQAWPS